MIKKKRSGGRRVSDQSDARAVAARAREREARRGRSTRRRGAAKARRGGAARAMVRIREVEVVDEETLDGEGDRERRARKVAGRYAKHRRPRTRETPPQMVDLDAGAVDGASSSSSSTTTLSLGGTATSAPARAEKMKTTRAAFERVVVPEAVSREGEGEFVREGVRVMTIAPDGASVYVGMTNGVVKQIRASGDVGAGAMRSFYPTPVNATGDEFNNANTPVRMLQISKASGEALVGYENGGWSKVSLDNGETTTWSAPHSDFADVFKYINVKKLSKYTNTAPQCRSMAANDDLSIIYLASPLLRDGRVYVWDLTSSPTNEERSSGEDLTFKHTSKLDDIDDVDAYDRCFESAAAGEREIGTVKHLEFHSDCVTSLVRVNSAIVSGSLDAYIAIWDLKSKVTPMQPHSTTKMTSAVREMTIAKDGRTLYCAGADGSVRIHDVRGKSGKLSLQWVRSVGGQEGYVTSLCTIKNDPFIVIGSSKAAQAPKPYSIIRGDGELSVWRVTDGELMFKTTIHDADVNAIVVTTDGKALYSGDAKGKICKHALGANVVEAKPPNAPIRKGFFL